jgi:hypothetical protein
LKRILLFLILGLLLSIVAISGCINSTSKTDEVLIKTIDVSSLNDTEFSLTPIIVDIPDNATNIKVFYNLTGGEYGSMSYIGTNSKNIDPTSGESPISTNYHYLQASKGQKINGTYNSTDHGVFYYMGNFVSGKISIYANIPA